MNNTEQNEIEELDEFSEWLEHLEDPIAVAIIVARIERAKSGNFGDHKFLRNEIWEMKINTGKGYRVYYTRKGKQIYLLLIGGDKTTQSKDIKHAEKLWKAYKEAQNQ